MCVLFKWQGGAEIAPDYTSVANGYRGVKRKVAVRLGVSRWATTVRAVSRNRRFVKRENTRIELPAEPEETLQEKAGQVIRLTRGKVLAVLGKNRARVVTATAVVGIRGTGLYLEADPEKTYVCLCYGKADLGSALSGKVLESVSTRHHESPRFIYKSPDDDGQLISPAPVINHTDAELILIESLVGRKPPFTDSGGHY